MQSENIESSVNLVIGIDIGMSGALALFDPRMNLVITIDDMPTIRGDKSRRKLDVSALCELLTHYKRHGATRIVLEDVHPMIRNGSYSAFLLGHSKGTMEGIGSAMGFELCKISPQKWKKYYGLLNVNKIPQSAMKQLSINKAKELNIGIDRFVARAMDHDRAEAALLAALPDHVLEIIS